MSTGARRRLHIFPPGFGDDFLNWNPINALHRQMNNLFDEFATVVDPAKTKSFNPVICVSEDEERLYVDAELPGLKQDEVELSLTKEALTIRGEKKRQDEKRTGSPSYYSERSYGYFERI